ncbi:MAG: hypothetical protein IPG74_17225 [Flavobacteriales bacterium]|nr:hypothetical protein [Flavobacteriales bacterium]
MNARYLLLFPICAMALQATAQVDPLDPGFGTNGIVSIPGTYAQVGEFVLPYDDGRLLVVSSLLPWMAPTQRVQCTRLLQDGTLDAGFGTGGTVELYLMGEKFTATDGALLPNGAIVLCGYLGDIAGGVLMKLLPDGSPDPLFDSDGIAVFPGLDVLHSVLVLADGSMIASGETIEPVILKVNAFGEPDAAFGNSGFLYPSGTGAITHLERTPGGDVVGAGYINIMFDLFFVKFTTTGDLVSTFGTNGEAIVPLLPSNDAPRALQILDDGRMMVAVNGDGADSYMVRLNADGTLDPSFGVGGVVAGASLPNGDFLFTSSVTTPQGTTIAGYRALTPGIAYVVRLDASGSPVLGFGNNGTYTLDPDTSYLHGACVTALGQVVVTGGEAVRPEHGHSRCAVVGQPRRHRTTCSRC